jgi:hypothetical protein
MVREKKAAEREQIYRRIVGQCLDPVNAGEIADALNVPDSVVRAAANRLVKMNRLQKSVVGGEVLYSRPPPGTVSLPDPEEPESDADLELEPAQDQDAEPEEPAHRPGRPSKWRRTNPTAEEVLSALPATIPELREKYRGEILRKLEDLQRAKLAHVVGVRWAGGTALAVWDRRRTGSGPGAEEAA